VAPPSLPIKPDDSVRVASAMKKADTAGGDGRWLDVPRLPQYNGETKSWLWCGRASAAMVHNYYCKVLGKTSEYIFHLTGKPGPGANGQIKDNLRWGGGSNKDALAGVTDDGKSNPLATFTKVGWKIGEGYLQKAPGETISTDRADVEKRFSPLIDQLKKNNPVMLFTRLASKNSQGHVVVVSGYKRAAGELWLRITDPTVPNERLLGGNRDWVLVDRKQDSFSEYWVRAERLLQKHPDDTGKLLLSYMTDARIGRYLFVADQTVKDDAEVVHTVQAGNAAAEKKAKAPPVAPAQGGTSLPFDRNRSQTIDAEALTALYHSSERGMGGFFPLGESGHLHCGAHFAIDRGAKIRAIAEGDVVAARLSGGPGTHPWGDTGFVLLRHKVKAGGADKAIYSLHLHLAREPLHPDRANAGWLKRLLIGAMAGDAQAKPKWRVPEETSTWKDADKGRFSPTNVQLDTTVKPGVYEEQERLIEDHGTYVKLEGGWIRASLQDGDGAAKELSPWSEFDINEAAKKSKPVAALVEGKVAVLDGEKDDKGVRRWRAEAGEVIGSVGNYLGLSQMHWSVFSKDAVFPSGSLPDKEFGESDEVKLSSLDVSSKDPGSLEQAKALFEALDPKKKTLAGTPANVLGPGEVRHFYRAPTESWRSRYLAVKAIADFKLDVDKLLSLEKNKSHSEKERKEFKENVKAFVFWDDLSSIEGFPTDGKAIFVHPASALRLMCNVALGEDRDDPPPGESEGQLNPHEDVTLALRDAKGPLASVDVTVKCDGDEVAKGKTDSLGLLLVPLDKIANKQIEIDVAQSAVPDKAVLSVAANDTGAARKLQPGLAGQTFNGSDPLPESRVGLAFRVKEGQSPGAYAAFNERTYKESKKIRALSAGETCVVERFVFHRDDGSAEVIQTHVDGKAAYVWSIWNGEHNFDTDLDPEGGKAEAKKENKEPLIVASWSAAKAHINDHPVLTGRVKNIKDGAELEITLYAMIGVGAGEHDEELHKDKVKVANGGFSIPFDPHQLASDHDLLAHPQPVFAKVKTGDKTISLRDSAITIYDGPREVPRPPPAPEKQTAAGAKTYVAFMQVARKSALDNKEYIDRWRTADDKEAPVRKLSQLSADLRKRFVSDGEEELYIGTASGEMHLASEDLTHKSAAEAITSQREALRALYPNAPIDKIFSKPEEAWFSDRGMTVGICAQDCHTTVHKSGLANGCNETIRKKNLLACGSVTAKGDLGDSCRTVIKDPTKLPIVAQHDANAGVICASYLHHCNSAHHDKSKCFLQTVVTGKDSVERARWYISFPWVTEEWRKVKHKLRKWPYHGGNTGAAEGNKVRGTHFRLLVMNPQNGKAVVASGQDWGNHKPEKEGNPAIQAAAVEKDEWMNKKQHRVMNLNPIVSWWLSFTNSNAHTVLFALVPASTPLGPVPDDAVITLRKQARYLQIMGAEKVEGAPQPQQVQPEAPKPHEEEKPEQEQPPAQAGPQGDRPLPEPKEYPGGNDMPPKPGGGSWPPSTGGTIKFIKADKPPQPDAWKPVQFRNHAHFSPDNCVDMNATSNKDEYPYGMDVYGPAVPFTPLFKFVATGFGGYVGCQVESGEVIEFGHFDHISAEIYYAAKEKKQLPAGTYLGKCTTKIGLSSGAHCHMQAKKKPGGAFLTRDVWLPKFMGVPADKAWWPGRKK
jgi:hypothetical protein